MLVFGEGNRLKILFQFVVAREDAIEEDMLQARPEFPTPRCSRYLVRDRYFPLHGKCILSLEECIPTLEIFGEDNRRNFLSQSVGVGKEGFEGDMGERWLDILRIWSLRYVAYLDDNFHIL